jgi:hypothetical protein
MSATQYQKVLERELARLNKRIDLMILKGQSYVAEARQHREILMQLNRTKRSTSMFSRFFNHATSY